MKWLVALLAAIWVVPIIFVALLLWYGFVVMADSWVKALLVGMGLGAVIVLGTAMQEGTGPENAQGLFVAAVIGTLILKAIHVYIEPLWRR